MRLFSSSVRTTFRGGGASGTTLSKNLMDNIAKILIKLIIRCDLEYSFWSSGKDGLKFSKDTPKVKTGDDFDASSLEVIDPLCNFLKLKLWQQFNLIGTDHWQDWSHSVQRLQAELHCPVQEEVYSAERWTDLLESTQHIWIKSRDIYKYKDWNSKQGL